MRGLITAIGAAWLVLAAGSVAAGDLPAPKGAVVLEVTGKIDNTNEESKALLDIDALKQLGTTSFQTKTPWTDGVATFEGVPATALIDSLGAKGTEITATAADNYAVTIPVEDLRKAIIAYQMNGQPLPEGETGPLWIVYPYDSDPALNDEVHHARSIWALKRLEVK